MFWLGQSSDECKVVYTRGFGFYMVGRGCNVGMGKRLSRVCVERLKEGTLEDCEYGSGGWDKREVFDGELCWRNGWGRWGGGGNGRGGESMIL